MRCGDCGVEAKVVRSGQHSKSGKLIFIDQSGHQWHQNKCQECKDEGVSKKLKHHTRKCRKCGCNLPVTRYFDCVKCKPNLSWITDDLVYAGDVEDEDDLSEEGAVNEFAS